MGEPWRVFGSDNSPYSIKVLAFFRYKQVPHTWLIRNQENQEEFGKIAVGPAHMACSPGNPTVTRRPLTRR